MRRPTAAGPTVLTRGLTVQNGLAIYFKVVHKTVSYCCNHSSFANIWQAVYRTIMKLTFKSASDSVPCQNASSASFITSVTCSRQIDSLNLPVFVIAPPVNLPPCAARPCSAAQLATGMLDNEKERYTLLDGRMQMIQRELQQVSSDNARLTTINAQFSAQLMVSSARLCAKARVQFASLRSLAFCKSWEAILLQSHQYRAIMTSSEPPMVYLSKERVMP